ncbi:MAG: RluA family pseudouridine synthase, partial [Bacilli bacterium]
DDHFLIVNKSAGQLLHPTEPLHRETLDHAVAYYFQLKKIHNRVRHVHRLDQETSGAVMYAKHPLASALLDEQLSRKEIYREYIAFVHGSLLDNEGTVNQPIGRDRHHPSKRRVTLQGDNAVTHYRVIKRYPGVTKVCCQLETGRTHQIRVHFNHLGHPLLGDKLYGGKTDFISRQALHAIRLQGIHPFGEKFFQFEAVVPKDLLALERMIQSKNES